MKRDVLEQEQANQDLVRWQAWLAESEALASEILERRHGQPLDVDALWEAARADLEEWDGLTPINRLDRDGQDVHRFALHPVPVTAQLDGVAQPARRDVLGQRVVEHHDQRHLPPGSREGLSLAQAHATAAVPGPRSLADS